MYGLLLAAAVAAATASEKGTADMDVVVMAPEFVKGTVKRVAHTGWADGESIVQCADQSPDWAEWSLTLKQDGLYEIYARFAAHDSRPVELRIDDRVVAPEACAETTGSWKSSSARWFPAGHVILTKGEHVLRMWRQTCIPHIVAFGFSYQGPVEHSGGLFDLPSTMRLRDHYRKQDWMIWTIGGIQSYSVADGTYTITDGKHLLNRPLYGTNGPDTVFAGDRPLLALSRGPDLKLGLLRIGVGSGASRAWLHDVAGCRFGYDGAVVTWHIDGVIPNGKIRVATVCLPTEEGMLVRLEAPPETQAAWWYGGICDGFHDKRAGHGPMPVGDPLADARGNTVRVKGKTAEIETPDHVGVRVRMGTSHGAWREWRADDAAAAEADFDVPDKPVILVVSTSADAVTRVLEQPETAWREAVTHRRRIADRLTTETPEPVLDAAMRGNNAAMDGQYRPPSFLHGALRWGTECGGWYLGWRGWYGPIMAGDWERVRGAAIMHAEHQFDESGGRLRGKVANFVTFDQSSSDTKTGYTMQEVFLDHLRCYYQWTGDAAAMRQLWPCISRALAFQRRQIGRNLNGLYTNAVNTWISDGHHYNGHACTQASAYAVSHNRFAAEVAALAGADPDFYLKHAEHVLGEMRSRLWIPDRGMYAEYVDGDKAVHAAAEAPTVYHAVEMGAADRFEAYQLTRYVDRRLWRFGDQILANDWFPVIVTNGLIGFNESLNTALAYYLAGRSERAWKLLKVCCDSTRLAAVPGSISCYGSRRGEQGTYVDFTDASSMLARTVVEGLFGLRPRVDAGRVDWTPRFPESWDHASMETRGFALAFRRSDKQWHYRIVTDKALSRRLRLPVSMREVTGLTVNGREVTPVLEPGIGRPYVIVKTEEQRETDVVVSGTGTRPVVSYPARVGVGKRLTVRLPGAQLVAVHDPQQVLADVSVHDGESVSARVAAADGWHTAFVKAVQGDAVWWEPVNIECVPPLQCLSAEVVVVPGIDQVGIELSLRNDSGDDLVEDGILGVSGQEIPLTVTAPAGKSVELRAILPEASRCLPGHESVTLEAGGMTCSARVCLWRIFDAMPEQRETFIGECRLLDIQRNDTLADIFSRKRQSANGVKLNNWTWYKTDYINTDALRERATDGILLTHVGVPFSVSTAGPDGLYASRWDPFPQHVDVPVPPCHADRLYLLLANHTHNSQTHMVQARVTLEYADGGKTEVPLRCPDDIDGMLQHYSDMAPEWIGGQNHGWYGHGRASGVHADVTDIETDPLRTLTGFRVSCVTEETLIGVLGATVHRVRQQP